MVDICDGYWRAKRAEQKTLRQLYVWPPWPPWSQAAAIRAVADRVTTRALEDIRFGCRLPEPGEPGFERPISRDFGVQPPVFDYALLELRLVRLQADLERMRSRPASRRSVLERRARIGRRLHLWTVER